MKSDMWCQIKDVLQSRLHLYEVHPNNPKSLVLLNHITKWCCLFCLLLQGKAPKLKIYSSREYFRSQGQKFLSLKGAWHLTLGIWEYIDQTLYCIAQIIFHYHFPGEVRRGTCTFDFPFFLPFPSFFLLFLKPFLESANNYEIIMLQGSTTWWWLGGSFSANGSTVMRL